MELREGIIVHPPYLTYLSFNPSHAHPPKSPPKKPENNEYPLFALAPPANLAKKTNVTTSGLEPLQK